MHLQKFTDSHKEFKWTPTSATVLNQSDDKVMLEFQAFNEISNGPILNPQILLRKPLNFDIETGWSWHKSWNLPEIVYQLDTNQYMFQDSHTYSVEIFAVMNSGEKYKYRNLGIKGITKKLVVQDKAEFKCLKFTTTSYNNNHQKFFLLLVLYSSSSETDTSILNVMLSSEIFVDSRKFARFHVLNCNQTVFVEPFSPEQLDQGMIKRETKNKTNNTSTIDDSIAGLINYYTASNIRNKIKHPLFLALKFSQSVKLFVDQKLANQPGNLVLAIQQNLINSSRSKTDNKMVKLLIPIKTDQKNLQKKAIEIIQQLENTSYEIYTQQCYLPNDTVQITDLKLLSTQYKSEFLKLTQIGLNDKEESSLCKKVCLKTEDQYQGKTDRNIDPENIQCKEEIAFDGNQKQAENLGDEAVFNINSSSNLWWGQYQQIQPYPQLGNYIPYNQQLFYYQYQYPYSLFRH